MTKEENRERIKQQVNDVCAALLNGYNTPCVGLSCDGCPAYLEPRADDCHCLFGYFDTEVLPSLNGACGLRGVRADAPGQMTYQSAEYFVGSVISIVLGETGCGGAGWNCDECPAHFDSDDEDCIFCMLRNIISENLINYKKP